MVGPLRVRGTLGKGASNWGGHQQAPIFMVLGAEVISKGLIGAFLLS